MRDFTTKQLMYMSFYYFSIIFLVACILLDVVTDSINGFPFGYGFAFGYFLYRTQQAITYQEVHAESTSIQHTAPS